MVTIDHALAHYAARIKQDLGLPISLEPGSGGAAGRHGRGALMPFAGAKLRPGIEIL